MCGIPSKADASFAVTLSHLRRQHPLASVDDANIVYIVFWIYNRGNKLPRREMIQNVIERLVVRDLKDKDPISFRVVDQDSRKICVVDEVKHGVLVVRSNQPS